MITSEEIRRSGVTSLQEALRLAPNLQVARIDASRYAISARGFNNAVGNKLLVQFDSSELRVQALSTTRSGKTSTRSALQPDIFDIELQHSLRRGEHRFVWGSGYRHDSDEYYLGSG